MNAQYKRGALEFAAWSLFATNTPTSNTPIDGTFRTRVKHLLSLDRDKKMVFPGANKAALAFYSSEPDGTGTDALYTFLDAVCLVLALDLLDLGFPQREAIFVLRHIRPALTDEIRSFDTNEKKRVQKDLERGYDSAPAYEATAPLYLLVSRREILEPYGSVNASVGKDMPIVFGPHFIRSRKDLDDALVEIMAGYRKAALVDLGRILVELPEALQRAPKTRRGPQ